MNKAVSVVLAVGNVLIISGVDVPKSFRPYMPSFFTGPPAGRTIRLVIF